jgi:hypothetical protein
MYQSSDDLCGVVTENCGEDLYSYGGIYSPSSFFTPDKDPRYFSVLRHWQSPTFDDMKPKSSCTECRQRHRRCISRPGNTRCNGCEELDKDCFASPRFQFQPDGQRRRAPTLRGAAPHSHARPHQSNSSREEILAKACAVLTTSSC